MCHSLTPIGSSRLHVVEIMVERAGRVVHGADRCYDAASSHFENLQAQRVNLKGDVR